MGYGGGTTKNPTYHNLGDHVEMIEIDFNPEEISFDQLLKMFWESHNPFRQPWSRQYMSIIICRDRSQVASVEKSRQDLVERSGKSVWTEILPSGSFYWAEEYHQKYYLRRVRPVSDHLKRVYPEEQDFVNSTAAARLNGYIGGYGSRQRLEKEITLFGLPENISRSII